MRVEKLLSKGYPMNLISQLAKLEDYLEEDVILEFIKPDTDVSLVRNACKLLQEDFVKTFNAEYKPASASYLNFYHPKFLVELIGCEFDPGSIGNFYTSDRWATVGIILDDFMKDYNAGMAPTEYKMEKLITDLRNSKASTSLSLVSRAFHAKRNPYEFFDPEFDNDQLRLSGMLYNNGMPGHKEEIRKMNEIPDLMPSQWNTLEGSDIPLNDIVNGYGKYILDFINAEADGCDVDYFIKCDPEMASKTALCHELLKMDRSEATINNILKAFTYDIENFKEYPVKLQIYMDLYDKGYPAEILFNKQPSRAELYDALNLAKIGYDHSAIKKFMKFLETDEIDDDISFRQLKEKDYETYFDLIDNEYDISIAYSNRLTAEDINILLDYSVKLDMDFEELLCRDYIEDDFEVINLAQKADRIDVIEAILKQDGGSDYVYHYIKKILNEDIKNGTKRDIIACLYDKGNDVFNDFDSRYEFDEEQKKILLELIADRNFTEEQIEPLRDNKLGWDEMWYIAKYIKDKWDVSELVAHIKEIDIYNIDERDLKKYIKKDRKNMTFLEMAQETAEKEEK